MSSIDNAIQKLPDGKYKDYAIEHRHDFIDWVYDHDEPRPIIAFFMEAGVFDVDKDEQIPELYQRL